MPLNARVRQCHLIPCAPFDKPFDWFMVLSIVEGLTALSIVEGLSLESNVSYTFII